MTGLPPGYEAGVARLQPGDLIVSIDGQVPEGQPGKAVFRLLAEKIGQNSRLRIQRGDEARDLLWMSGSGALLLRSGFSRSAIRERSVSWSRTTTASSMEPNDF